MSARRGTVWLGEEDEEDPVRGGLVYTGLFDGHLDDPDAREIGEQISGATLDEALAWARERADHVYLRLAWENTTYSAGAVPAADLPPWRPELAPRRRRPPGHEWRDRDAASEPIVWDVMVALSPPSEPPRPDWSEVVAARAERMEATGWSARSLVPPDVRPGEGWWVADLDDDLDLSELALMTPRDLDRPSAHGPFDATRYRVTFALRAATAEHAMEDAIDRCAISPEWAVVAMARPAMKG